MLARGLLARRAPRGRSKQHKFDHLPGYRPGYLVLYNVAALSLWACVNVLCLQAWAAGKQDEMWGRVQLWLKLAQTMSVLEVVHAAAGLVRSNPATAALQAGARLFVLWLISDASPTAQANWSFALMATSWALVEVPRYLFYLVKLLDLPVPAPLLWLRYSLFLVLYPPGIIGEMGQVAASLGDLRELRPYSMELPNPLNLAFSLYAVAAGGMLLYPPGGYIMYTHMLRQRRKVLGGRRKAE